MSFFEGFITELEKLSQGFQHKQLRAPEPEGQPTRALTQLSLRPKTTRLPQEEQVRKPLISPTDPSRKVHQELKTALNTKMASRDVAAKYNIKLLGKWKPEELEALDSILSKLPSRLVSENQNLKAIGRAPVIKNAPPHAPGHSMYKPNHKRFGDMGGALVVFDKGAYSGGKLDKKLFAKSILHELTHSFNLPLSKVFGRGQFVTGYAGKNAREDFAESFAEYFLHPKKLPPDKAGAIKAFLAGDSNGFQ